MGFKDPKMEVKPPPGAKKKTKREVKPPQGTPKGDPGPSGSQLSSLSQPISHVFQYPLPPPFDYAEICSNLFRVTKNGRRRRDQRTNQRTNWQTHERTDEQTNEQRNHPAKGPTNERTSTRTNHQTIERTNIPHVRDFGFKITPTIYLN